MFCNLGQDEITRYGRQLILPEIGVKGQNKLLQSSVLIVGAGGLGCPALQYLVGAGVGRIGIVDYDQIELGNLHRQVVHTEQGADSGQHKATSAANFAKNLNNQVQVDQYKKPITRDNAQSIIEGYDVVLDATDNAATSYLINDVCVLTNKPLISGSALGWEGQLSVFNYQCEGSMERGLCYRCLFPKPSPPHTVRNCSSGGVVGPVPGIIGTMQALEAIKIVVGMGTSLNGRLFVFDATSFNFKKIRLRKRQPECVVCGDHPSVTLRSLPDYEAFCGSSATDKCVPVKILTSDERISASEYNEKFVKTSQSHVLLDVRPSVELQICHLLHAINIPSDHIEAIPCEKMYGIREPSLDGSRFVELRQKLLKLSEENLKTPLDIIVVCKQGNNSQKVVRILKDLVPFPIPVNIRDIRGGLQKWSLTVDSNFPIY